MRTLLLCALLIASAGCNSYQLRKPDVPPLDAFGGVAGDLAQVCVMRPHWVAWAVTAEVRDNGELVGATRGDTYFCYLVRPGHHRIESETVDATERAELDAAPGGRYWLHQIVDNYVAVVRTRLQWVDEAAARGLVEKCGYRVLAGVPGDERIPSGEPVASEHSDVVVQTRSNSIGLRRR